MKLNKKLIKELKTAEDIDLFYIATIIFFGVIYCSELNVMMLYSEMAYRDMLSK